MDRQLPDSNHRVLVEQAVQYLKDSGFVQSLENLYVPNIEELTCATTSSSVIRWLIASEVYVAYLWRYSLRLTRYGACLAGLALTISTGSS
jgi:hypothetical protein